LKQGCISSALGQKRTFIEVNGMELTVSSPVLVRK
jgi:hypothetical protein